jgi:hypothetical protein
MNSACINGRKIERSEEEIKIARSEHFLVFKTFEICKK